MSNPPELSAQPPLFLLTQNNEETTNIEAKVFDAHSQYLVETPKNRWRLAPWQ